MELFLVGMVFFGLAVIGILVLRRGIKHEKEGRLTHSA